MTFTKIVYCTMLLLTVASCEKKTPDAQTSSERPNIIFLLADDMRYDMLGANGNENVKTPHLDKLAHEGVNFKSNYVTTSICSVSRASILSGQYGRRHELWGFGNGFTDSSFQETYPMQLKSGGYHVGFVGKYGVGPIDLPASEFDFWRGFPHQGTYMHKNKDGSDLHLTEKIGNEMVEFLDSLPSSKPFALSVSFKAPHVQDGVPSPAAFMYDGAYQNEYEDTEWIRPFTFQESFYDHFPSAAFGPDNVARTRFHNRFSSDAKHDESLEGYYRLVHGIDVQVGRIVAELKERDMQDNTIIIFTSDNGFYLGEYGFAGKWYGSEPSIKTPFIIYDPRNGDVREVSETSLNIDIAPTILEMAGLAIPDSYQGRNALGNTLSERSNFLYEHLWPVLPAYPIPSTEGVVSGQYKYMQYFKGFNSEDIVFEELYDLTSDPNETNNLAKDETFSDEKIRLKNELAKLIAEAK